MYVVSVWWVANCLTGVWRIVEANTDGFQEKGSGGVLQSLLEKSNVFGTAIQFNSTATTTTGLAVRLLLKLRLLQLVRGPTGKNYLRRCVRRWKPGLKCAFFS